MSVRSKVEMRSGKGGHRYKYGNHHPYPSVTEMLGWGQDKKSLVEWKRGVGEKVAKYIQGEANGAGSAAHRFNECYLLKRPYDVPRERGSLLGWAHHHQFLPYLKRVSHMQAVEIPLISRRFELGGTVDCIANYDGIISVIDWKTKRKTPKRDFLKDHFVQACVYSMMYEEMTNVRIDKLVIVYSSETRAAGDAVDFRSKYEREALQRISAFREYYKDPGAWGFRRMFAGQTQ